MKESAAVIGNSSSGIIEAPCLQVPTVNIGDRQKGRLMPESVLCCEPESFAIEETIQKAVSDDFHRKVQSMKNPFGNGETSEKIVHILKSVFVREGRIGIVKKFYDIGV